MKKITITLIIILIKLSVYSQSEFIPGYIQKTEHDTIFGLIDYAVDKSNSMECRFRKTEKDPVQIFSPKDIYGYRFNESKYYVSKEIKVNGELKMIFMEYLVEGRVDLYFYRNGKGDHYLLGRKKLPIMEISIPTDLVSVEGTMYERSIFVKRNIMKFYLKECPQLYPEIDKLLVCSHKSLIQLIKKYHNVVCPTDFCLIYQKKLPKLRIDIQSITGITSINSLFQFDGYNKRYSYQFGILSYFWLPITNERMFLRTGLIINHVKGYYIHGSEQSNQIEKSSIKIPMQVHYQFFNANITPVISGGLNIYSTPIVPFALLPAFNVGVNAKISDKTYVTLSTDFDYASIYFLIPAKGSKITSYSFNIGLAVIL